MMNVNGFSSVTANMHSSMQQSQFSQDFTQHYASPTQASPPLSMHHNNQWPLQQQNTWLQHPLPTAPTQSGGQHASNVQPPNQHNLTALNPIPYISPQIMQDAIRMSSPVGSNPTDEAIMVQILYESPMAGQTYKQALESLHGINNHAASLWKDYYLDHKPRIDRLVAQRAEQNGMLSKPSPPQMNMTIQAPRLESFKASSPPSQRVKARPKPRVKERPPAVLTAKPTKRSTINSITSYAPPQLLPKNLTPPQADIVVPRAPSRSPTPPTHVIPGVRGNKYTQEDKDYFIKFILWRLKCNPELTKPELCALLAEKAPHHTVLSWSSHWHGRHELADKILAMAKGEIPASDSEHSDPSNLLPALRRKRYDVSSIGEYSAASNASESEGSDDDSGSDFEYHSEFEDENTDVDVKNMGASGSSFTKADTRIMAKYIAGYPHWETMSGRERFEPFEDMYPQRSWKSWGEFYRRCAPKLLRMAQDIKQRRPPPQRARRGRPFRLEQDSLHNPNAKRMRMESTYSPRPENDVDEGSDADAYGETDENA